eukprot:RCo029298
MPSVAKFSPKEVSTLKTAFFSRPRGITSASELGEVLRGLGEFIDDDEVEKLAHEAGHDFRRPGHCISYEVFLSLMSRLKTRCQAALADPYADTLEAFVALGGSDSSEAAISSKTLEQVCSRFLLSVDLERFIAESSPMSLDMSQRISSTGNTSINFAEFAALFHEDEDQRDDGQSDFEEGEDDPSLDGSISQPREEAVFIRVGTGRSGSASAPGPGLPASGGSAPILEKVASAGVSGFQDPSGSLKALMSLTNFRRTGSNARKPGHPRQRSLRAGLRSIMQRHHLRQAEVTAKRPVAPEPKVYEFVDGNTRYVHQRRPETPQWIATDPSLSEACV